MKKKCFISIYDKILQNLIYVAIGVMVALSVLSCIFVLCDCIANYPLSISRSGFECFCKKFKEYESLYSLTAISLTAFYAIRTYISSKHLNHAQILSDIRAKLTTPENQKIHALLESKKEEEISKYIDNENGKAVDLYNYLGILETLNYMIDTGLVDIEEVKVQFDYRIENIYHSAELTKMLKADRPYWTNLISLLAKLGYSI